MIIYFSGSGNSALVATWISEVYKDQLFELTTETSADLSARYLEANNNGEKVVWVSPVHSWGLPRPVVDFIKSLPAFSGTNTERAVNFLVLTMGDDVGLTDKQLSRLLKSRGYSPLHGSWAVRMPNTYTMMKGFDVDSDRVVDRKMRRGNPDSQSVAKSIQGNVKVTHVYRGRFAWIKSKIIYPWFIRHAVSTKPFHATEACVGCGLCAKGCPMKIITMKDGRPEWKPGRCAMCERCYHHCPTHAIAYGNKTDGKGQWNPLKWLADYKAGEQ